MNKLQALKKKIKSTKKATKKKETRPQYLERLRKAYKNKSRLA